MAEPQDNLFDGPHPAGCEHGMIEEHYDAGGHLLGHYRWDPAYARVPRVNEETGATEYVDLVVRSVTYPCPRCKPLEHTRWAAGCYRTDGSHHHGTCTYCQEDGRRAHTPR